MLHANNKDAAQPGHLYRMMSIFCHLLSGKYITAKFALCKVSKFKLVSVAKQPSLSLTLSETPDRFSLQEAYFRNEFNFLNVHGIMNTLVLLLSK